MIPTPLSLSLSLILTHPEGGERKKDGEGERKLLNMSDSIYMVKDRTGKKAATNYEKTVMEQFKLCFTAISRLSIQTHSLERFI